MQTIGDVISNLNNNRMGLTSEICYEHKVLANGKEYVKEIKKFRLMGKSSARYAKGIALLRN